MVPRDVARYRISRERLSTKLGEPVRGVVAARIVAAFVFLGGFSVLTLHERSARYYGAPGVVLRGHSPSAAGAEESDERLCCSGIRAWAGELPAKRDCGDWKITQCGSGSAFMCSSDDHGRAQEPSDCC